MAEQKKHIWATIVPGVERFRSNPDAPVYKCVRCYRTVDLRDAIFDGGWGEAKGGVCPGRPSSSGPQDFHLINVVAPHA